MKPFGRLLLKSQLRKLISVTWQVLKCTVELASSGIRVCGTIQLTRMGLSRDEKTQLNDLQKKDFQVVREVPRKMLEETPDVNVVKQWKQQLYQLFKLNRYRSSRLLHEEFLNSTIQFEQAEYIDIFVVRIFKAYQLLLTTNNKNKFYCLLAIFTSLP
ncbi:Hypothetical_protein [Hexamita inflata]|uniref:Hypothetical_protein n=1 Tax=Hexamita inflata TaxID=28002 RepID=A0ABP1HH47_9EUKA